MKNVCINLQGDIISVILSILVHCNQLSIIMILAILNFNVGCNDECIYYQYFMKFVEIISN